MKFDEVLGVIAENGTVDTTTEAATKVDDIDAPSEGSKIDKATGKVGILRMASSNDLEPILARLRVLVIALPTACDRVSKAG